MKVYKAVDENNVRVVIVVISRIEGLFVSTHRIVDKLLNLSLKPRNFALRCALAEVLEWGERYEDTHSKLYPGILFVTKQWITWDDSSKTSGVVYGVDGDDTGFTDCYCLY